VAFGARRAASHTTIIPFLRTWPFGVYNEGQALAYSRFTSMRLKRIGIWYVPEQWLRDDWIVSRPVARFFLFASIYGIVDILINAFFDPSKLPPWAVEPATWLVLGGAVPIILLYLGMWRYWFRIDKSKPNTKRIWFLVLLVGLFFASIVYCFSVYLPQVRRASFSGA
jgi:hypothetical protein